MFLACKITPLTKFDQNRRYEGVRGGWSVVECPSYWPGGAGHGPWFSTHIWILLWENFGHWGHFGSLRGSCPPIYNTRSWQTFTKLCYLVCRQYLHQRPCKEDITVLKHCSSTCGKRDWCGSESELESELESESIFPGRSRSRWNLVDSVQRQSTKIPSLHCLRMDC